jgi:hypothetical protein
MSVTSPRKYATEPFRFFSVSRVFAERSMYPLLNITVALIRGSAREAVYAV